MGDGPTHFDQVVFSGGGTRCIWQGGFMHVLRGEIDIAPQRITGVSGGAASACGFVCHRGLQFREAMIERFARHDQNFPLHEPFNGEKGMTPHQRIWREIVEEVLGDVAASRMIGNGPQIQILIARPPSTDWPVSSGTAVTLAYLADMTIRSNPHLAYAEAAGLTAELIDANRAAREGWITDLVCAAATIPPAFEPPTILGAPAVDAGMADQAPLPEPDEGTTLILLTRKYRGLPDVPGRLYVEPSDEVPADKIDFTDPDKLRRTWAQGEQDAKAFLAAIDETP